MYHRYLEKILCSLNADKDSYDIDKYGELVNVDELYYTTKQITDELPVSQLIQDCPELFKETVYGESAAKTILNDLNNEILILQEQIANMRKQYGQYTALEKIIQKLRNKNTDKYRHIKALERKIVSLSKQISKLSDDNSTQESMIFDLNKYIYKIETIIKDNQVPNDITIFLYEAQHMPEENEPFYMRIFHAYKSLQEQNKQLQYKINALKTKIPYREYSDESNVEEHLNGIINIDYNSISYKNIKISNIYISAKHSKRWDIYVRGEVYYKGRCNFTLVCMLYDENHHIHLISNEHFQGGDIQNGFDYFEFHWFDGSTEWLNGTTEIKFFVK